MKDDPDFLGQVRSEVIDPRVWIDRAVVGLFALLAGLSVVLFTLLADAGEQIFKAVSGEWRFWPLLWTPALTALVVWATMRFAPGAGGSGPPQALAALDPRLDAPSRSALVSLKISLAKALAVFGGLLAGLSIGRQGPSVQIAAGVMYAARRFLSPRSGISARELLVAGSAAGIAAAFNTPLGGIVFAIEELSRRLETRSSGLMLGAIVMAGLVAVAAFGNLSYFGRIRIERVGWGVLLPGLTLALCCGLLGGLFARLLIVSLFGGTDRFSAVRRRHPIRFAAACGLAVAVIGILTQASAVGGGHAHTRTLLAGDGSDAPLLWTLLKFVATWLSAWSGAPGGALYAQPGDWRQPGARRGAAAGARPRHRADRAGHGGLSGGHDANAHHRHDHRDGDGRRLRHAAGADVVRAAGQPCLAHGQPAAVRHHCRPAGGAAGAGCYGADARAADG